MSNSPSARQSTEAPAWPPEGPVLLFDGTCHLCQRSVQFVLRHEREPRLLFCPLQSAAGKDLLARHNLPEDFTDSLVLIAGGRANVRSQAALNIAPFLRRPWSWLRAFRVLPRAMRDWMYDQIASRRYRWFGRDEAVCQLLTPDMSKRLLDLPPGTSATR